MKGFKSTILTTFSLTCLLSNPYPVYANEVHNDVTQSQVLSFFMEKYYPKEKNTIPIKPKEKIKPLEIKIDNLINKGIKIDYSQNITLHIENRSKIPNQKNFENIVNQIDNVPIYIKKYFNKVGVKFIVFDGNITDVREVKKITNSENYFLYSSYKGMYLPRSKIIVIQQNSPKNYIKGNSIPMHEIGHAVHNLYRNKLSLYKKLPKKTSELYARNFAQYFHSNHTKTLLRRHNRNLYNELKFMEESFKK